MNYLSICGLAFILLSSSIAKAANCELIIERQSCPGREEVAYRTYKTETNPTGNPTSEMRKSTTQDKCIEEGKKATPIIRAGTLLTKKVKVKFKGVEVGEFSDQRKCRSSFSSQKSSP